MSYPAETVETTYEYLSNIWFYYDADKKKININNIRKHTCGDVGKIIADGEVLELSALYNETGQTIIALDEHDTNQAIKHYITDEPDTKHLAERITNAHNNVRKQENQGLQHLVWNEELARYAQSWANTLQQSGCEMHHRQGKHKQKLYGENLAWARGKHLKPETVVALWHEEINDYDYASNTCSGVCGHYTQVIWKTSRQLGCAIATCDDSEVWVCNYYPAGNWVGERPY